MFCRRVGMVHTSALRINLRSKWRSLNLVTLVFADIHLAMPWHKTYGFKRRNKTRIALTHSRESF